MAAEESSPSPPGDSPPPGEPDLLAERRARRAARSGETALVRRAQAAEATVRTLEIHLATLQRRLEEAEQERRRTSELSRRLEAIESELRSIRDSHRRIAATVHELRQVAMRLRAVIERHPSEQPVQRRRDEMAGALAAAVERLRARAEASMAAVPEAPPTLAGCGAPASSDAPAVPVMPAGAAEGVAPPGQTPPQAAVAPAPGARPHKHSMSLIGRWRAARKHRHERG